MKYRTHEVKEYLCDKCETPLGNLDGHPYYEDGENNYCPDCALKIGVIDAEEWLTIHGIGIYDRAIYKDGIITAYQKWGRGYRKDEVKIFDNEGINGLVDKT